MERYDYRAAMKKDIEEYLEEADVKRFYAEYDGSRDAVFEHFYDEMWAADSITGNGSGSYFFSTWKAEEAICHNLDLLHEAYEEFGCGKFAGAEAADVTIRCYLLGEILGEVLDEIEETAGIETE